MGQTDGDDFIFIGLGANLPSAFGAPRQTLEAALGRMTEEGLTVRRRSRFWRTRPVPISEQPWFVNAVVAVESDLAPRDLMALLHRIEASFGRVRSMVNAARLLDLDLLAHGRSVVDDAGGLQLPHPRMAERAFVLLPLRDIAPRWVHPVSGETIAAMIARLPEDSGCLCDDL